MVFIAELENIENYHTMREEFWFVSTEHLKDTLWFKDDEDFRVGMNYVAVSQYLTKADIMAFVLMSNHVHFVLRCCNGRALEFINGLKMLYSKYSCHKHGSNKLLYNNKVDLSRLFLGDDSFEKAVAYIQMNPVAANICLHPSGYPWGSGSTFFSNVSSNFQTLGQLSRRKQIKLLHTKVCLPAEYKIEPSGYILPSSYIKLKEVESIFRTPLRMDYFLRNSSKAKKLNEVTSFNDQLVISGMKSLCISVFRRKSIAELSDTQKSELFRQLRYRFSADPHQIARCAELSYEEVCRLLELL